MSAPARADRFDAARALIQEQLTENRIPSIAVAVVQDGKIVWEEGFGWADRENRKPATEHSMYLLASTTKSFTATALMTLVQAGKVDLDRPINDYMGQAQLTVRVGDGRQATVRRIANHTSGLSCAGQTFFGAEELSKMPPQALALTRYSQIMMLPGERFEYCNNGYGVLDYVIEQVSGRSYADYLRQEVFLPLGMTHTSVNVGPGLEKYAAARYDRLGDPIPFYESTEPGAGAMFSSAHDLARFGLFILKQPLRDQKAILSSASIDAMTRDPVMIRPGNGYALGWQVQAKGGYTVHAHGGSHSGTKTSFNLIPEKRVGVVLLANANEISFGGINTAIFKALLPQWKEMNTDLGVRDKAPDKALQPDATLVGEWRGDIQTHEGAKPMKLQILASGDIHLQIADQLPTLLSEAAFRDGLLTGVAPTNIQTSDTKRSPHFVDVALKLRDGVLNGYVRATAEEKTRQFWIYSLPHWTELRRVQ
ncbi:serine hydrolase domain-containing protein [Steroidobacter sp.]|uniref:serine hydrolase domain-containing protein n=1 Tax=Steroidobacter sp. TaxID=1978227 RepID=UPI0025F1FC10|nr:serine hydrolase domain-containing protein [Steroidobacter sp.]